MAVLLRKSLNLNRYMNALICCSVLKPIHFDRFANSKLQTNFRRTTVFKHLLRLCFAHKTTQYRRPLWQVFSLFRRTREWWQWVCSNHREGTSTLVSNQQLWWTSGPKQKRYSVQKNQVVLTNARSRFCQSDCISSALRAGSKAPPSLPSNCGKMQRIWRFDQAYRVL